MSEDKTENAVSCSRKKRQKNLLLSLPKKNRRLTLITLIVLVDFNVVFGMVCSVRPACTIYRSGKNKRINGSGFAKCFRLSDSN